MKKYLSAVLIISFFLSGCADKGILKVEMLPAEADLLINGKKLSKKQKKKALKKGVELAAGSYIFSLKQDTSQSEFLFDQTISKIESDIVTIVSLSGNSYKTAAEIKRLDELKKEKTRRLWINTYDFESELLGRVNGLLSVNTNTNGEIFTAHANTEGEVVIVKFEKYGAVLWSKKITGLSGSTKPHIEPLNDGGLLVSYHQAYDKTYKQNVYGTIRTRKKLDRAEITLVKFNAKGDEVWETESAPMKFNYVADLDTLPNGEIFLTGHAHEGSQSAVLLSKYNKSGESLWEKTFTFGYRATGMLVHALNDGSTIIAGQKFIKETGDADLLVVKIGPDGNKIWESVTGAKGSTVNSKWEFPYSIVEDRDGAIIIAGLSDDDGYALKFNRTGDIKWEKRYDFWFKEGSDNLKVLDDGRLTFLQTNTLARDGKFSALEVNENGDVVNSATPIDAGRKIRGFRLGQTATLSDELIVVTGSGSKGDFISVFELPKLD